MWVTHQVLLDGTRLFVYQLLCRRHLSRQLRAVGLPQRPTGIKLVHCRLGHLVLPDLFVDYNVMLCAAGSCRRCYHVLKRPWNQEGREIEQNTCKNPCCQKCLNPNAGCQQDAAELCQKMEVVEKERDTLIVKVKAQDKVCTPSI